MAALIFLLALCAPILAGAAPSETAQSLLSDARTALGRGDAQGALGLLRSLRAEWPGSPLVADSLALSARAAVAAGDEYKARYFVQALLDASPRTPAALDGCVFLADHYYDARQWALSLSYYGAAIDNAPDLRPEGAHSPASVLNWAARQSTEANTARPGAARQGAVLDRALLRSADLSLYHASDPEKARGFLQRIVPSNLRGPDALEYRTLRVRLLWSVLTATTLGLKDSNVSSLTVDEDDLWVGTWNGGVSRYTVSSGQADPFPAPAYSRSIEIADRRVWVGTSEGLVWYGKTTGRWGSEREFAGSDPRNVPAVRMTGAGLFAGTLGDGLFRRGEQGWAPVSDGSLPGKFVTSLAEDPTRRLLLIGTMNMGLVIMDMTNGAMSALSEIAPGFTAQNVTTVLRATDGTVWIGTYGDGIWSWTPGGAKVSHYGSATGETADDWVLSSCETDHALYFGTFGGGVAVRGKTSGAWRRIGIRDGLAALDVPAIAWRPPYVFFGTLGAGVSRYDEEADGALP